MDKQFEITEKSKQLAGEASGVNFQKVDIGPLADINKYSIENKQFGLKNEGKVFLHDYINLTGSEISINSAPVGFKVPFKHKHKQNEEVYIFIKGQGVIEVDGTKMDIKEGSVVKVSTAGIRSLDNTGNEPLIFIVVQAKENSLGQFTLHDGEIVA